MRHELAEVARLVRTTGDDPTPVITTNLGNFDEFDSDHIDNLEKFELTPLESSQHTPENIDKPVSSHHGSFLKIDTKLAPLIAVN